MMCVRVDQHVGASYQGDMAFPEQEVIAHIRGARGARPTQLGFLLIAVGWAGYVACQQGRLNQA